MTKDELVKQLREQRMRYTTGQATTHDLLACADAAIAALNSPPELGAGEPGLEVVILGELEALHERLGQLDRRDGAVPIGLVLQALVESTATIHEALERGRVAAREWARIAPVPTSDSIAALSRLAAEVEHARMQAFAGKAPDLAKLLEDFRRVQAAVLEARLSELFAEFLGRQVMRS